MEYYRPSRDASRCRRAARRSKRMDRLATRAARPPARRGRRRRCWRRRGDSARTGRSRSSSTSSVRCRPSGARSPPTEFEKETGIKVAMTLKGSGESFAQIAAEKANPKLDVWFGGTGDPHLQAAEQGLLEEYKSPMLAQLQPWAQRQAEQSKYRTVGHVPRRARHRLQHRAPREEEARRRPRAGRTSSSRSSPAKCRWRIRTPRAPRTRRSPRSCR